MAFEQDLVALLPRLRRFARGLTGHHADADDLCQAAIERALTARQQWQVGTRLDSWMYRITRNLWIDRHRADARRGSMTSIDDSAVQIADNSHQRMEAQLDFGDVDRAMATLPPEQREAVVLVLVEGYSYREAADIASVPVGTLTSRLGRGREALATMLGEAA
ncbi:RNA polymerase sigma factor [Blastomonas sp.]|uniref:RNA polymerase sigma factor n=1 Tax=Blastomonas sp. TaxID=1909299 RepID=UPI0035945FD2